jgi:hypothetical protein
MIRSEVARDGAKAVFVGPRKTDLLSAVTGPGLVLSHGDVDFSQGSLKYEGSGFGVSRDNVRCHVTVFRLDQAADQIQYAGRANLTEEQMSGLTSGELAVVIVNSLCDTEADR